ncbi:MAG: hypothetical protein GXP06_14355 [Alphaproteobacteria bacterium]|nr:hypothetical protein [Alphaproteobacteria bacterium]
MGNLTDGDAPPHKCRQPWIILIYTLAGPPIGGIIAMLSIYVYLAIETGFQSWLDNVRAEPIQIFLSLSRAFITVAFYGYIFGGIQALLTGIYISLNSGNDGKFGYGLAITASVFVALAVTAVLTAFYQIRSGYAFLVAPIILGAIGIAASVIVRFLFRKRFSPKFSKP